MATFKYVLPSFVNCHLSSDSFQRKTTLACAPRSISNPALSDGSPVTLEFNKITLSSTANVSVLRVVVLPLIVKLPVTVRSPETDRFPFL